MVDGYSAEQIRAAERPHLAAGEPLMQRAAAGLAGEIRAVLGERVAGHPGTAGRIMLLVGSGDNGGDGLFAGAELAAEGVRVSIVPTGGVMHESGLAAALAAGAHVVTTAPLDAFRLAALAGLAEREDVIVDAIVGTGSSPNPALRGAAHDIVAAILPVATAPGGPAVVAVDIPSGIDPTDGSVPDPVVLPADVTVTFGGVKAGLLLPPGSGLAGQVRLVDIGLGADLARLTPVVQRPE